MENFIFLYSVQCLGGYAFCFEKEESGEKKCRHGLTSVTHLQIGFLRIVENCVSTYVREND